MLLVSCAYQPFDVHDGKVRFTNPSGRSYIVAGADARTFEDIGGHYGIDANRVFFAFSAIEGADRETFKYIGRWAARDSNAVYVKGKRCADCDPQSFRHVSGDWYADKNFVYDDGARRTDIDSTTFKVLNEWFAKDKNRVYQRGWPVRGADAASFKLASCGICIVCGDDKNRCYWYEHPVPCDCAPHSAGEFPFDPPILPKGKAYLTAGGYPDRHIFLESAQRSLPGVHGKSANFLLIDAGRYSLPIVCKVGPKRGSMEIPVVIKSARLYRVTSKEGTWCDPEVQENALVVGRAVDPEIQIRLHKIEKAGENFTTPGANPVPGPDRFFTNRQTYLEFRPGRNTFSAVCREVTRAGVLEKEVRITEDLMPGRLYQVHATFHAPNYACNARLILLEDANLQESESDRRFR